MKRRFFASAPQGRAVRLVRNASAGEATLYVYDEIGPWYGVNARDVAQQLAELDAQTIHVRINSPGGDMFAGIAIANALRAHSATVVTHVDGMAASAASLIAIAGDEVVMADNAWLMIHEPWTIAAGNAQAFRDLADTLDGFNGTLIAEYVKKTGLEADVVAQMMADETWLNAADAIAQGFADRLESDASAAPQNRFDLSIYRNTPRELRAAGGTPAPEPKRDLERTLRDAGYSREQAKAIAAKAADVLAPREVGEPTVQDRPQDDADTQSLSTSLAALCEAITL